MKKSMKIKRFFNDSQRVTRPVRKRENKLTIHKRNDMLKSKRVQGIKDSRGQVIEDRILEPYYPQTLLKNLNCRFRIKEVSYGVKD